MNETGQNMEENLGYHIGRTYKILHHAIQKILEREGFNISTDQWILLIFLKEKGGFTQQLLSRMISKDKATVTRIIDDLEKKKLVNRIPGKVDRRENTICLTRDGEKFIKKALPLMRKMNNSMMKNITMSEFESLKRILGKISDNIIEEGRNYCISPNQKIENHISKINLEKV